MIHFFEVNPGDTKAGIFRSAYFDGRQYDNEAELFYDLQQVSGREKVYCVEGRQQKSLLWLVEYVAKHHPTQMQKMNIIARGSRIVILRCKAWFSDLSAILPALSVAELLKTSPFYGRTMEARHRASNWIVGQMQELGRSVGKNNGHNTVGSLALDWFAATVKGTDLQPWYANRLRPPKGGEHTGPEHIFPFVRAAFAGGRAEMYKLQAENFRIYDQSSAYLSTMVGLEVPWKKPYRPHRAMWNRLMESNAFGYAEVTVSVFYLHSPLLWVHTMDNGLIFPVGTFRGIYPLNEIRAALDHGYTIEAVHDLVLWRKARPFDRFCEQVWKTRVQAKREGNSFVEKVAKLAAAQLHGKLGAKNVSTQVFFNERPKKQRVKVLESPWKGVKLYTGTKSFLTPNQKPEAAAWITASQRLNLHRMLTEVKDPIYCDTDSVHTFGRIDSDGRELGGWKLEHVCKKGVYRAPKNYTFHDHDGKEWNVVGGIPKDPDTGELQQRFDVATFRDVLRNGELISREIFRGAYRAQAPGGSRIHHSATSSTPPSIDLEDQVKIGRKHYAKLKKGGER